MFNEKAAIKTATLQIQIDYLIDKGNTHIKETTRRIKAYRLRILYHNKALKELPVIDIRTTRLDIKILEAMLKKTHKKIDEEGLSDVLKTHKNLIQESIKGRQEILTNAHAIEKQRFIFLNTIHYFDSHILKLKYSKYLKKLKEIIQKKQLQQFHLAIFPSPSISKLPAST